MKEYAIIVAGGSGSRMKSPVPKQFMLLAGRPVLMHTIEAFRLYSEEVKIILVLPQDQTEEWKRLCEKYSFRTDHQITAGGPSRFYSVKNGLFAIEDHNSLVAIHDGVRPLVSPKIIENSYRLAYEAGTAIASMPLKESLRKIDGANSKAVDRTDYRSMQTPQTFKTQLIIDAFGHFDRDEGFTDDASVAEKYGLKIHLFDGSYKNIKITTPEDLLVAGVLLQKKRATNS